MKPDAEQIFQTEDGYVLFSPNGEAVTTLFRQAGAGNAKTVLALAVAADCPVWYEFTQLFENFNLSQQEYQIDYTIYSDSPYTDAEARWMFCARRSWRGIRPTFSLFTPTAIRPRRLRPVRSVQI
ncbi:MAG: hypothetical protein V8T00_01150 [Oscillospiraceae bacterium]